MFVWFKQKTAYGMRSSDWSSDVCSSDLIGKDIALTDRGVDRIGHRPFGVIFLELPGAVGDGAVTLRREGDIEFLPHAQHPGGGRERIVQIGRASCRERVCQYV